MRKSLLQPMNPSIHILAGNPGSFRIYFGNQKFKRIYGIVRKDYIQFVHVTNLGSGVYEHRVGVINKLGKVGAYSEWVRLEVVVSKVPTLTNDSIYSISKEDKQKVFDLQGTDFVDQMRVYMVIDGKKFLPRR